MGDTMKMYIKLWIVGLALLAGMSACKSPLDFDDDDGNRVDTVDTPTQAFGQVEIEEVSFRHFTQTIVLGEELNGGGIFILSEPLASPFLPDTTVKYPH